MALTRRFRDTVAARAKHDAAFRAALFEEAIQALLDGETEEAKTLLRDCINATVGFDALAYSINLPVKSVMRMVGPDGNPTLKNFGLIVSAIQIEIGMKAQAQVYDPNPELYEAVTATGSTANPAEIETQVALAA
jgi:DNA-binding phage protein